MEVTLQGTVLAGEPPVAGAVKFLVAVLPTMRELIQARKA